MSETSLRVVRTLRGNDSDLRRCRCKRCGAQFWTVTRLDEVTKPGRGPSGETGESARR